MKSIFTLLLLLLAISLQAECIDCLNAIDDMIEALNGDKNEKDLVKDGPSWQEIHRQIETLKLERKEVDRRLYSLQMDINIFKGY